MRAAEKSGESFPCGYGLLGLCCSDCLEGPCRISPFDKGQARGRCGADADLLVARSLVGLTCREGLRSLKSLRDSLGELKERMGNKGSPAVALPHLLPESAVNSLADAILDLAQVDQKESKNSEEWWPRCLRAAIPILAAEELREDLFILMNHDSSEEDRWEKTQKYLESWPDAAQPFMILFSTEGGFQSQAMELLAQGMKKNIHDLHSLSIRKAAYLPRIARFLGEKWSRPVSDLAAVVLVESSWILPALGSLALGFSAASQPSLPIQGSETALSFFRDALWKKGRNFYLAGEDETALSRICASFQEKTL